MADLLADEELGAAIEFQQARHAELMEAIAVLMKQAEHARIAMAGLVLLQQGRRAAAAIAREN